MATNDAPRPADSGDYSATQAPENQEHVTSEHRAGDEALKPGGEHGVPVPVGMEALDRATVPALEREVEEDGGDAGSPPSRSDRD